VPSTIAFDDLLSAGWLGMAEALQRRRPEMEDDHFEAYASRRVRGAILDYLRCLDPLSRSQRRTRRRMTQAAGGVVGREGRPPTDDEMAAELGVSVEEYRAVDSELAQASLAHAQLTGEERAAATSPEHEVAQSELADRAAQAIKTLPERLQMVLSLYYQDELSLREIGGLLGVTESRICQLHSEAVRRIKSELGADAQAVA
jgi:RNA polymerase sigma factor for flagellar operon FliA